MSMSRRTFVQTLGSLALSAVALPASAAEFSWKFGHGFPASHPLHVRALQAAARIKQESGGRVDISVFPNSQLGGDNDLLSQVHSGGIDMFSTGGVILSTLVPNAALSGIGFAFADYSTVWPAMDGKLGAYVRNAFQKSGLHALDRVWDNGFRETTTSTRAIANPADFANLKIRVPISPLYVSLFKALNASPTSINLAEVYTALQTRVVDGQENPLIVSDTAKFYEVQKYCSLTNHIWDGCWIVVNGDSWESLTPDLRTIVSRAFNAAALQQRGDIAAQNTALRDGLQKKGLKINQADPAPFRAMLQKAGFYTDWKNKFGPEAWGVLEASVGRLT
ncbi:TRAP transporter substrate-binding protein [Paraburkholderia sp. RL17-337-BIB-A]|uniref:TRAP transporter substrate-binding protein n=1 Tax=Paraburkholderia sp. RL17-337-BIB-A TaxID=3031636 RepID=UPI0038BD1E6E